MGHGDYSRPGPGWDVRTNPFIPVANAVIVLGANDFQHWDQIFSEGISLSGGTFAPSSPIYIGGAGGRFNGGGGAYGGVKTWRGGRLRLGLSNDWPLVSPPRSHVIHLDLATTPAHYSDARFRRNEGASFAPVFSPYSGIQTQIDSTMSNPVGFQVTIPSRYLHDAATLTQIELRYRVGRLPLASQMANTQISLTARAVTPVVGTPLAVSGGVLGMIPVFGSWAAATSYTAGTYIAPTTAHWNGLLFQATSVSGTHTSGGSEPAWPTTIGATVTDNAGANQIIWTAVAATGIAHPTDPAAYFNNGQPQSVIVTPLQFNVVDVGATTFFVQILEQNTLAGNVYHSLRLTYSNIQDLRPA